MGRSHEGLVGWVACFKDAPHRARRRYVHHAHDKPRDVCELGMPALRATAGAWQAMPTWPSIYPSLSGGPPREALRGTGKGARNATLRVQRRPSEPGTYGRGPWPLRWPWPW